MTGEEWAVWIVQALIGGVVGIVGWSVKLVLADMERRLLEAESACEAKTEEFGRMVEEVRAEHRRESEAHLRRCDGLQGRLGGVERLTAIDAGRWEGLQRELTSIRACIERLEGYLLNGMGK